MILLALLGGCAHTTTPSTSIEFTPSSSMCLDATLANIRSAGCTIVTVDKTVYGRTILRCDDPPAITTTTLDQQQPVWITHEFYGIAFGSSIPSDVSPLCTDPFMVMTVAERD